MTHDALPPDLRRELRDHIAEAFARYDWNVAPVFRSVTPNADHYGLADAVLAELPATPEVPAEDPARIDRLRPEFTEHSSVEAIDVQLRRARSQERRWHLRTERLVSLRADRVAQKERGEWPAAGARQDGARQ